MAEYEKIETKIINGFTVVSKTLKLSEEEKGKKYSEINEILTQIAANHRNDKTA
jgi:hypothetical protein